MAPTPITGRAGIRRLAGCALGIVAIASGCGGSDMSRDEMREIGSSALDTRDEVISEFGEGMDLGGLTKSERRRCLYYERDDPAFDGQANEVCFTDEGKVRHKMSVATQEQSMPGPAVPIPGGGR